MRDKERDRKLKESGWKVVIVWECELKDKESLTEKLIGGMNHFQKQIDSQI